MEQEVDIDGEGFGELTDALAHLWAVAYDDVAELVTTY